MRSAQVNDIPEPSAWFVANYPWLIKTAWFVTEDQELAKDIAQDASVKILKAWPDPRQRELIVTSPGYVHQIVVNAFRSHLKNKSRTNRREVPFGADDHEPAAPADTELRLAILKLPDNERDMLMLRYAGYTILEAGRMLGLSRDRAYRLNARAGRSLNDLLTGD